MTKREIKEALLYMGYTRRQGDYLIKHGQSQQEIDNLLFRLYAYKLKWKL